jgi:hypothetical protein
MILLAFLMCALSMLLMIFLWRERTRHESHYKKQLERREGKK